MEKPFKSRSNRMEQQQQQFEDHDVVGLDDIEDFDDSPPRQRKGQLEFPRSQAPPRPSAAVNGVSTPIPQSQPHQRRKLPSTSTGNSGKRKSFYDEIDPELLALASAGKKSKKEVISTYTSKFPTQAPASAPAGRNTKNRSELSTIAPRSAAIRNRSTSTNEPQTPTPQSQFYKSSLQSTLIKRQKGRGFEVDPDLLAAAPPVITRAQSENRKLHFTQPSVVDNPLSSATMAPKYGEIPTQKPPPNNIPTTEYVSQGTTFTNNPVPIPSDETDPDSSPQSNTPPPCSTPRPTLQKQNQPANISPSLKSVADSIEDHPSSPIQPRESLQKLQKPNDIEEIEADVNSESDRSSWGMGVIPQSSNPKHMDDSSTTGDSITDPDFMETDDNRPETRSSLIPMHKRMLKRLKQSKLASQSNIPPRPGYIKLLELHKTIVLPKPPAQPPGTPPMRRWFVHNGLADTVKDWKETVHGTKRIPFQDDKKKVTQVKNFQITVNEFLKDGQMIIIKGFGENNTEPEGILKVIISGTAVQKINDIGCVVRYAKPWFPIKLFGEEEPYRCLIGPLDIVNPTDIDVQMTG